MGWEFIRAFSSNPPHDRTVFYSAGLFCAIGIVVLTHSVVHLSTQPWDLDEIGVQTWGRGVERTPFTGDRYVIRVNEEYHRCYRGRTKFPATEAPILYDPADPSRCRASDSASGLSEFERTQLLFGSSFFVLGLAWLLASFAEPREEWARTDPRGLLRPRLMWAARVVLVLGVGAIAVVGNLVWTGGGYGPDPPVRTRGEVEASGDVEASNGTVRSVPPEPVPAEPIVEVRVRVEEGDDWPSRKPRIRNLPLRGSSVWIGDPKPIGSRLVVSTGPRYHGRGTKHHLVDVAKGEVLAAFDDEGITAAGAGVVVTWVDGRHAIVHAADGLIVVPEISLPSSQLVERVRIVASEIDEAVWVFALSAADGTVFHGHWEDPRRPEITLRETLPIWPRMATGEAGIEVWDPEVDSETCWRYRFEPGSPPRCLDDGAHPFSRSSLDPTPLDPWWFEDDFDPLVVDRVTGRRYAILAGCRAHGLARLATPPRRLVACWKGSDATATFAVWAPGIVRTFSDTFDTGGMIRGGSHRSPVTTLEQYLGDGPRERWIDLETTRLVRTPPLVPLVWGGSWGFERKVLVQRPDEPHSLWLLDIEAATLVRIVSDVGCPHELMETSQRHDRVLVACNRAAHEGGSDRLRGYVWTEVVDLEKKARWRTRAAFEGDIAEDGTVAAVTRARPARLVAIETP